MDVHTLVMHTDHYKKNFKNNMMSMTE